MYIRDFRNCSLKSSTLGVPVREAESRLVIDRNAFGVVQSDTDAAIRTRFRKWTTRGVKPGCIGVHRLSRLHCVRTLVGQEYHRTGRLPARVARPLVLATEFRRNLVLESNERPVTQRAASSHHRPPRPCSNLVCRQSIRIVLDVIISLVTVSAYDVMNETVRSCHGSVEVPRTRPPASAPSAAS